MDETQYDKISFNADRDIPGWDGPPGVHGQGKRPPGMELAMGRLRELVDAVTKATMILDERTAPVRLDAPGPPHLGADSRTPRPAASELANALHGYADQLEQALAKLTRIGQEIDL